MNFWEIFWSDEGLAPYLWLRAIWFGSVCVLGLIVFIGIYHVIKFRRLILCINLAKGFIYFMIVMLLLCTFIFFVLSDIQNAIPDDVCPTTREYRDGVWIYRAKQGGEKHDG